MFIRNNSEMANLCVCFKYTDDAMFCMQFVSIWSLTLPMIIVISCKKHDVHINMLTKKVTKGAKCLRHWIILEWLKNNYCQKKKKQDGHIWP